MKNQKIFKVGLMFLALSVLIFVCGCQSQNSTDIVKAPSPSLTECPNNLQQIGQSLKKADSQQQKIKKQWVIDKLDAESPFPFTDTEVGVKFNLKAEEIKRIREYWHVNGQDIAMMSEQAVAKSLRKMTKAKPDHPKDAMLWRRESLVNQVGNIPADAFCFLFCGFCYCFLFFG